LSLNQDEPMTTFQDARRFLLEHRTDYAEAVAGFRWPAPIPFNWAFDWFDGELASNPESLDRPALWIVETATDVETKFSFKELSSCVPDQAQHLVRRASEIRHLRSFLTQSARSRHFAFGGIKPESAL
jgi:hypothetical protein